MAFEFWCYGNDDTIATTSIYSQDSGKTYTVYYGDTLNLGGFSYNLRFTANPDNGCEFVRWVYRLGSTSGEVQYSYDNPFTYSGTENIYIRAEGQVIQSVETPWNAWGQAELYVTDSEVGCDIGKDLYAGEYGIDEYCIYEIPVKFANSGYVHFYLESDIDTIGYLSDSNEYTSDWSKPLSILASDDDSGDGNNFDIKYYVTAGKQYYIFVRGHSGTETTGYAVLWVTVPCILNSSSYGTLSATNSENITISRNGILYRRAVSFSKSGTVTISTSGGQGLRGWLGTSPDWDYGQPISYISPESASSGFTNFSHSYKVVAGQTYYIWVAPMSTNTGYTFTLNISNVQEQYTVVKWSWSASNGSASASQTSAAYSAVVNKTAVTNFSYLVWNDLVDKVKKILDATGDSWDSSYATYANTKMTSSDKTLTATKFNSLRYNIGSHYSTGIYDVAPNDDVLGSYFITLASCINSWIDTL